MHFRITIEEAKAESLLFFTGKKIMGDVLNPNEHNTEDNHAPIPPGEYTFIIEKAGLRDTKTGGGKYVWIQASIRGNQCNYRKVFAKFNILNPSNEAQTKGRADLARLALAIGVSMIEDTSELIYRAFIGRVKAKDDEPEWLRIPDALRISGLSRSSLHWLISVNKIKSASLRERGAVNGICLISYDSLAAYIENAANQGGEI